MITSIDFDHIWILIVICRLFSMFVLIYLAFILIKQNYSNESKIVAYVTTKSHLEAMDNNTRIKKDIDHCYHNYAIHLLLYHMNKTSQILFIIVCALLQNPFSSERYSSGYIDLQRNEAQMFYWLQFKRSQISNPPLILWLQGGPGCSSMIDQFTDIGSFNVLPNGTIF